MNIPKGRDVMARAHDIADEMGKLRFLEIQMDAAMQLSQILCNAYSLQARKIVDPLHKAATEVCEYDWSDNDDDAAESIDLLRRAL